MEETCCSAVCAGKNDVTCGSKGISLGVSVLLPVFDRIWEKFGLWGHHSSLGKMTLDGWCYSTPYHEALIAWTF
jgi:hypothetical protein